MGRISLPSGKGWSDQADLGLITHGGLVTPGAGCNVNVGTSLGHLAGVEFFSAAMTNLTVAAGSAGGQTIRSNIVITASTGVVTAVSGVSATTGLQAAPALAAGTVLVATVDAANGGTPAQADISNSARNYL